MRIRIWIQRAKSLRIRIHNTAFKNRPFCLFVIVDILSFSLTPFFLFLILGSLFHNSLILQYKDVLVSEYAVEEGEQLSPEAVAKTREKLIKVQSSVADP
jgi:hypothetical protein